MVSIRVWAKGVEVWVWEQLLLAVLVTGATVAQVLDLSRDHLLTWRTVAALVFASGMTLVSQKSRSFADRQAERNRLAGVADVEIECHKAQARWSLLAQVLGLFTSLTLVATVWHLLIGLYVGLYSGVWRELYRAKVRAWRQS